MRSVSSTLPMMGLLVVVVVAPARAQGLALTPVVGVHTAADRFSELNDRASEEWSNGDAGLVLGLNAELGFLRGSLGYVTGATFSRRGVDNTERIGSGSVLVASGDVVLRPIPRLLAIQPYLLGGVGAKRRNYSFSEEGVSNPFPSSETDLAFHAGVGADVMLGNLGVVFELSDYITRPDDGQPSTHDAFANVGLRIRMF